MAGPVMRALMRQAALLHPEATVANINSAFALSGCAASRLSNEVMPTGALYFGSCIQDLCDYSVLNTNSDRNQNKAEYLPMHLGTDAQACMQEDDGNSGGWTVVARRRRGRARQEVEPQAAFVIDDITLTLPPPPADFEEEASLPSPAELDDGFELPPPAFELKMESKRIVTPPRGFAAHFGDENIALNVLAYLPLHEVGASLCTGPGSAPHGAGPVSSACATPRTRRSPRS
eukprot:gnl/TRDRNA2_/TRDRNA2_58295_c0_seq1.p1 gnl/TRDRNA2_/TRDRNA2_58295_c0~~gnl/TRDRNA2_/TRDRNA2_58295_c0_seq1.p1  ORF type:complete len:232 (+),score=37.18 gnl/TRDRNA2_/TRDRNA2_58295_c0_seq1:378-1073(+)